MNIEPLSVTRKSLYIIEISSKLKQTNNPKKARPDDAEMTVSTILPN